MKLVVEWGLPFRAPWLTPFACSPDSITIVTGNLVRPWCHQTLDIFFPKFKPPPMLGAVIVPLWQTTSGSLLYVLCWSFLEFVYWPSTLVGLVVLSSFLEVSVWIYSVASLHTSSSKSPNRCISSSISCSQSFTWASEVFLNFALIAQFFVCTS